MTSNQRSGIARAALLITLGGLASRILGLVREQLAASHFGTGDAVAAFQIADNIQTLIFDLAISGMLQAALIPILVSFAAPELRIDLRRISGTIMTVAFLLVGGATLIGWIFTDQLVRVMTTLGAGDQQRSPETVALTEHLVRIVLPGVVFLAVGTVLSAVLYSLGKPGGPATALAARNLAVVVCILLLADRYGVKAMAYGVLFGGMLVAAIQIPWLIRAHALPRPNLHLLDPAVRHIGRLYLPVFLGLLISTVQVVVDRNLAWRAETDALGAMRYATTLVQSVLGLVAAAISLAALPLLATHFANRDEDAFNATVVHAVRMVSVLIIPAVIILAAVSGPVVTLLFQHGETNATDAHRITVVLLAYLPGTLFAAYDQILIYLFYARRSTWIPVLVGVAAVGFYFVTAFLLVDRYGAVGLAVANSVQFIAHTIILMTIARERVSQIAARCLGAIGVAVLAASVAGAVAFGLASGIERTLSGFVEEVAAVVLPLGVAGLIYGVWVLAAGIPEARSLATRIPGLARVGRSAAT